MNRTLFLIRHAHSQQTSQPADRWGLAHLGQEQAQKLAAQPFWADVGLICTSLEPKAVQTAQIVAEQHALPVEPSFDLHELRRTGPVADYTAAVDAVLSNPSSSVQGWEPAAEAQTRIVVAVERLLMLHERSTLAVVTHGLVLTLYLAFAMDQAPSLGLWQSIPFAAALQIDPEAHAMITRYEI